MKLDMKINNVYYCRTDTVHAHCVATVDWLTGFNKMSPSKLFEMWSVLNIETELERMKMAKVATKKAGTSKQQQQKSLPTTPSKTPKTRGQKKAHTKVRKMKNELISIRNVFVCMKSYLS